MKVEALDFARGFAQAVLENRSSQAFFFVQQATGNGWLTWEEVVELCEDVVAQVDAKKRVLAPIKCARPKKAKLSFVQKVVVDAVHRGATLKKAQGFTPRAYVGTETVRISTLSALLDAGVVEQDRERPAKYPWVYYRLKDAWK